jgi:hypothetical protein
MVEISSRVKNNSRKQSIFCDKQKIFKWNEDFTQKEDGILLRRARGFGAL